MTAACSQEFCGGECSGILSERSHQQDSQDLKCISYKSQLQHPETCRLPQLEYSRWVVHVHTALPKWPGSLIAGQQAFSTVMPYGLESLQSNVQHL